jgi:galactose mutarotase-like enzyme
MTEIRRQPWITLSSGELRAEINPVGAELSVLQDSAGRDLLWNGDASVWAGRAPLLFPIVGALAGGVYRLAGDTYRLPRHGFARGKNFQVLSTGVASAAFRLSSDQATLEVYPFRFELDVEFTLSTRTLSVTTRVRNLGETVMPASFGYHPGLCWPLPFGRPRASHRIEFSNQEPAPIRRLNSDGLLLPESVATPVALRRLPLTDALFQDDVVIFDKIQSRSVSYGADSGPRIEVSYPDAPYLGIWSKPGANFICIEPWHGIADPQGFTGDFTTKPGIFLLAREEMRTIRMAITLLED